MHLKNGHAPYTSTADGLEHFPEICTAIGVYLDAGDEVRLVAPYGVEDLARLLVRPTPFYASGSAASVFRQRMSEKKWQGTWPGLTVVNPRVSEHRKGNGAGETE